LAVFEDYELFLNAPNQWQFILSNKTILGGFLGALITIELTKWWCAIRASSGDLMTYPIIVGLIIGRVGCFTAGLEDGTYGVATTVPWGINMGDGIKRHPTNLYEILFLLCVFYILKRNEKWIKNYDGLLFKFFLSSYLLFRFFIEFIKPDPAVFAGLSAIQIAALGGIIYYCLVIYSTVAEHKHA
jgi:prolipoprotein diacylglyceryltransferase